MTVDVSIVISALSLIVAVVVAVVSIFRGHKSDTAEETSQLTTVIVKLEIVANDLADIKRDLRAKIDDHAERLVKVEQQIKVLNNEVFGKGENK